MLEVDPPIASGAKELGNGPYRGSDCPGPRCRAPRLARVLKVPRLIVPGYGAPFTPDDSTPR